MTAPLRVLIVDDQQLLRRGLRMILETDPRVEVIGEAEDGARALELIGDLDLDVVLADARMPRMDGEGLVRACAEIYPELPVLVLTTFDDARLVRDLLDAGAAGFLLKDISIDGLVDALQGVTAGGLVLDPRVARAALATAPRDSARPELTAAESAVARLVAQGLPNAEIARRLHLAHGTVKNTVSTLLRKLDAPDRTVLALRLAAEDSEL